MSAQPKALRLADSLDSGWCPKESPQEMVQAAAELRRLSKVEAQRDALLKALKGMLLHMGMDEDEWNKPTFDHARAAIKAVEGENHAKNL